MRSLRLRIFVLTALILATVLGAVAFLSWSRAVSVETQRLDERMCHEVFRLAETQGRIGPGALDPRGFDLLDKLQLESPEQVLFAYDGSDAQTTLRSANWPTGLDIDALAWAAAAAARDDMPEPRRGDEADRPGQERNGRGRPPRRACALAPLTLQGDAWRAAQMGTDQGRAFVAASLVPIRTTMRQALRQILVIALPLAVALTALGAWLLASLVLKPVRSLSDAMTAVNEKALDQRLAHAPFDREFETLIRAYNTMLARLEASFRQASRFSADAAHELKTPLAILQGQLERAIQHADQSPVQRSLIEMLDEVARLAAITRKLLFLSQADAGRLALMRSRIDLSKALHERIDEAQSMGLNLHVSGSVEPGLVVAADAQLLEQVLNNLMSNALKYTPTGRWVSWHARAVSSRQGQPGVEILVSNSVDSITPEQRARFFERFFRSDAARNRQVDGHGLGLSLSRVIARAHGGDLTLEPSTSDVVVLRLFLPRDATAQNPSKPG